MSTSARIPRGRRGTFASITAVLGVLVFAAAATEAISLALNNKTLGFTSADVAKFGRDTHLGDSVVLIVALVAFILGVILILAALLPARRRLIELTEPDPNVAAGLTTRSFHRTLVAAATEVDGVSDTKVGGGRRIKVTASTSFRDTSSLPDRVADRVTTRLNELNPAQRRTVRVVLNRKDD